MEALVFSGEDIEKDLKSLKGRVSLLEKAKLMGLYSDIHGEAFVKPSEMVDEVMAKAALNIARGRLEMAADTFEKLRTSGVLELPNDELKAAYADFAQRYGILKG